MAAIVNLFLILSLVFMIRAFFYEPFRAVSRSMSPTIESGDILVVKKLGYGSYGTLGMMLMDVEPSVDIERGQVLVFKYPQQPSLDYVMRVTGLPGDRVKVRNGDLFVNDQLIPVEIETTGDAERYFQTLDGRRFEIFTAQKNLFRTGKSWEVPDKHLFVMGDNRPNSNDSRFWGFVPTNNVVGQIEVVF